MNISYQNFLTDSYAECLEEIGAYLVDYVLDTSDDMPWMEKKFYESSIEAYFDALQVGGTFALDFCSEELTRSEDNLLLGCIYVLAGTIGFEDRYSNCVLNFYSQEKHDDQTQFIEAFRLSADDTLSEKLLPCLENGDSHIRAATAEILGYRGDTDPRRIWPLIHDKNESVKIAAMVAVMRLGFKDAVPAMEQAVLQSKESFNEHCLFPLLMLGSNKALRFIRLACVSSDYIKPQYPIYLALGGNQNDLEYILKCFEFDGMASAALEALGIFGSLGGLNILLQYLESEDEEEQLAAAKSLNQISGAQLYEYVTVTEQEAPDLDAKSITGKPSINSDDKTSEGDQREIEIKRDCTDINRWRDWWQQHQTAFDSSIRYRSGKPYSFFLCLEEIANPESKHFDRHRAYYEVVMRSGNHIPFEPDWFVDKQITALKRWQTWWNQNKVQLNNPWMFDGV